MGVCKYRDGGLETATYQVEELEAKRSWGHYVDRESIVQFRDRQEEEPGILDS